MAKQIAFKKYKAEDLTVSLFAIQLSLELKQQIKKL